MPKATQSAEGQERSERDLTNKELAMRLGGAAALSAGAYDAGKGGLERLVGAQRLYHGTSDAAADAIRRMGLLANKGGNPMGGSAAIGSKKFVDASTGRIHVAKGFLHRLVTSPHAALAQARANNPNLSPQDAMKAYFGGMFFPSGGTVVEATIPFETFKKHFEQDPDQVKDVAFRSFRDIRPEEMGGGIGAILRGRSENIGKYLRENPDRALRGLGLAALAAGGAYGATQLARPAVSNLISRLRGPQPAGIEAASNSSRTSKEKAAEEIAKIASAQTFARYGLFPVADGPTWTEAYAKI